jgi:hypothetical protein
MAQIDLKQSVQETNCLDADIIIDIATGAQEHEKQPVGYRAFWK